MERGGDRHFSMSICTPDQFKFGTSKYRIHMPACTTALGVITATPVFPSKSYRLDYSLCPPPMWHSRIRCGYKESSQMARDSWPVVGNVQNGGTVLPVANLMADCES